MTTHPPASNPLRRLYLDTADLGNLADGHYGVELQGALCQVLARPNHTLTITFAHFIEATQLHADSFQRRFCTFLTQLPSVELLVGVPKRASVYAGLRSLYPVLPALPWLESFDYHREDPHAILAKALEVSAELRAMDKATSVAEAFPKFGRSPSTIYRTKLRKLFPVAEYDQAVAIPPAEVLLASLEEANPKRLALFESSFGATPAEAARLAFLADETTSITSGLDTPRAVVDRLADLAGCLPTQAQQLSVDELQLRALFRLDVAQTLSDLDQTLPGTAALLRGPAQSLRLEEALSCHLAHVIHLTRCRDHSMHPAVSDHTDIRHLEHLPYVAVMTADRRTCELARRMPASPARRLVDARLYKGGSQQALTEALEHFEEGASRE